MPVALTTAQPKSNRQIKREAAAAHARKGRIRQYAILAVVAVIAVVGIGLVVREVARPKPGQDVPVMAGSNHIAENSPKPEYTSNPPTSGPHYATPAGQGFYDKDVPKDETLVHNLEHGYIILWYDCSKLDQSQCDTLKSQVQDAVIRAALSKFVPSKKLITAARKDFGATIALTSWGRILKLDKYDATAIDTFILEWRDKSPESNAA